MFVWGAYIEGVHWGQGSYETQSSHAPVHTLFRWRRIRLVRMHGS